MARETKAVKNEYRHTMNNLAVKHHREGHLMGREAKKSNETVREAAETNKKKNL